MLVTHRGLSGPSILQISSYWQPGDALRLDLLPTLDAEAFLREQRQSRPAAELKTVLSDQLPQRFAQRLCEAWLPNRPMRQYKERELNRSEERRVGKEGVGTGRSRWLPVKS